MEPHVYLTHMFPQGEIRYHLQMRAFLKLVPGGKDSISSDSRLQAKLRCCGGGVGTCQTQSAQLEECLGAAPGCWQNRQR